MRKWKNADKKRRAENVKEARTIQSKVERFRGSSQHRNMMFLPISHKDYIGEGHESWRKREQLSLQESRHKRARDRKKKRMRK